MPVKPSGKEDEYFARLELEQKKKAEEERLKNIAEEEKKRLKDLHYMRCPKCGMELTEVEFKNIKIDKCLNCGGIFLDAGELEVISTLEKSRLDKLFFIFKK